MEFVGVVGIETPFILNIVRLLDEGKECSREEGQTFIVESIYHTRRSTLGLHLSLIVAFNQRHLRW